MDDDGLQRARKIAALQLRMEAGLAGAETLAERRAAVAEAVAEQRRKRAAPGGGSEGAGGRS